MIIYKSMKNTQIGTQQPKLFICYYENEEIYMSFGHKCTIF